MRKYFKLLVLSVLASASLSASAFSGGRGGGGHGGGGGPGGRLPVQFWRCTATGANGAFFMGVGRTQALAYTRAAIACGHQTFGCAIDCEPIMN